MATLDGLVIIPARVLEGKHSSRVSIPATSANNLTFTRNFEIRSGVHPASCSSCTVVFSRVGMDAGEINPIRTKLIKFHLNPQSVPRCKHFSSRL